MALDFPSSPSVGQQYNGYVWNGYAWDSTVATPVSITSTAPGYNYVINGAFDINQRNFTSTTASGYVLYDRWTCYQQGGGTTTFSAQDFTPGAAPSAATEGTKFLRAVTSGYSAAASLSNFTNKIEDVRSLAGNTVTASFWAKAASGTPKVSVEFNQYFGTGGSGYTIVNAGAVTLSTSWARYSVTVAIPGISGKTIGAGNYISLDLWMTAGSDFASRANSIGAQNNTFDFWGVQVEAGGTATAFKRNAPSIQAELAACQRYYVRFSATVAYGSFGLGASANANLSPIQIKLPVTMRSTPSSSIDWTSTGSNYAITRPGIAGYNVTGFTFSTSNSNSNMIVLNVAHDSVPSAGAPVALEANNNANAYLGFSAEL